MQAPRVGPALLVLLAVVLALVVPAAGRFQTASAVRVARPTDRPVLTFGSRGRPVRHVQTLLNRRGYRVPVTGFYGVLTVRQVRRFQVDHGIRNTGQVGPLTWPVLLGGGGRIAAAARSSGGVVYLTFDDGPTPAYTPQILALLARYRARATFFVVGRSAVAYPGLVGREFAAGHGVGNHTFTHASLPGLGSGRLEREVGSTNQAIRRATGAPARCLRPPYGAIDSASARRVGAFGLRIVTWTLDSNDWRGLGSGAIAGRVLGRVRSGDVVLMHDGGGNRTQTVAALGTVLSSLSARGFRFAALCRG